MEPQGSLHNQQYLSPVEIEVYLLQVFVAIESARSVRTASKEGLVQFIGILEVNVILFYVETTLFTCIKLDFFYSRILYIKI